MAKNTPKHYVYKGKELEENYIPNLIFSFLLSVGIILLLFVGVKKIEFGTYKPSFIPKPVNITFAPVIQRIEEAPPPSRPIMNIKVVEVKKQEKLVEKNKEENIIKEEEVLKVDTPKINPIENIPVPVATSSEEVYEFFKVEVKPQVIKAVQPEYPELAKKAGIEGRVVISVVVDEEGKVISAEIVSSTNSIFNESALKAAYEYKFSPAMMKDKKVKVRVLIPFNFVIRKWRL